MNLGGKEGLDALLKDWPSPFLGGEKAVSEQDDERRWDERADAIVKAALEKKSAAGDLDALLAAPNLPPEAGESGDRKMSADKEPGETTNPPPAAQPGERKRQSLKEIAARASQSGRPSSPGPRPSTPPASVTPLPPRPSATATPLPRPAEAGKEDSGVINLNVVAAAATPQQVAAAEKAQPGQVGLFDDDKTVESAVSPTKPTPAKPTNVAVVAAKRSNTGPIAGGAIAILGIAAAFAIIARKPPPAAPVADTRPTAVMTAAPPPVAVTGAPAGQASATPTAVAEAPAAGTSEPTPGEPSKGAEPGRVAVAPGPGSTGAAPAPGKDGANDGKVAAKEAPAAPTGKPGDLQSEMARAVGAKDGEKPAPGGPAPEMAARDARSQNIPEQPSQGSVQAAVNGVMGGARACVSGADEPSRAQVTFSSAGTVSSVSVTGWAASNGKSACVQAALKGAKVGPFSKPSFMVGVTIRP